MKKSNILLSALVLLTLFSGCSLTPGDSAGSATGLRLLVTSSNTRALSDPAADDWSPQVVSWKGTNYLYFVSTRHFFGEKFNGSVWQDGNEKGGGTNGIFRAVQDKYNPELFSNLQLYAAPYETEIKSIIVVSNGSTFTSPVVYATTISSGGETNMTIYSSTAAGGLTETQRDLGSDIICGGKFKPLTGSSAGTNILFIGGPKKITNNYTIASVERELYFIGTAFHPYYLPSGSTINSGNTNSGEATLQFYPDRDRIDYLENLLQNLPTFDPAILNAVRQNTFNPDTRFSGLSPALFTHPLLQQKRFGFYTSINGVLSIVVYTDCTNYTAFTQSENHTMLNMTTDRTMLDSQRIFPLITVTHYPGTIDQDPHFVRGKGLFFSSDRAGKGVKNLYFVPQEHLSLPDEFLDLPVLN